MAQGLLLCDDLMFASRITGTARGLELSVQVARSVEQLQEQARQETPGGVIVDLANPGLKIDELVQWLGQLPGTRPRVIAYGSHVDTDTLRAARQAGCDEVMPRSQFVEKLPVNLGAWLQV